MDDNAHIIAVDSDEKENKRNHHIPADMWWLNMNAIEQYQIKFFKNRRRSWFFSVFAYKKPYPLYGRVIHGVAPHSTPITLLAS
ncbi:hypothetical protein [Bifidobacterium tibiigranuli]|jgi:hypothetical protein|uniref:hypothetical protein n=1 Tax=Bifidobacterium tibiigranuli TaxID=2172043 RepID=UPI0026EA810C|nr:hypothetical protein [Bifidobacterium tibiigranuli]MCI1650303.1 hypothetical protein [Bifidobacterium tibiigranuli]MCI2184957.1 hypothetical protein [Bifidobacterium tibiigranuli]MCI2204895.1 hypothetical protein [Bifidobacterium tibiigranuli]